MQVFAVALTSLVLFDAFIKNDLFMRFEQLYMTVAVLSQMLVQWKSM